MGNTTISIHEIIVKTFGYVTDDKHIQWCETSLNTETRTTQSRHESAVCSLYIEKYSLLSLVMAHTKQTPRNPNIDRPTAAMGSDVQPER